MEDLTIFRGLRHENIVALIGMHGQDIVTELMELGSVEKFLKKSSKGDLLPSVIASMFEIKSILFDFHQGY